MKRSKFQFCLLVLILAVVYSCNNDSENFQIENSTQSDAVSNTISEWNTLFLELDRHAIGMRPNATARALAYIHLAAYETAILDINGFESNQNRLEGLTIDASQRSQNIDLNLSLNACYTKVYDHFMYNVREDIDAKIEVFNIAKYNELRINIDIQTVENSINWGNYVAQQIIAYSQTDFEAEAQILNPQPHDYEPATAEGYWTYSADAERGWFPYWENVRTFVISTDETTSVAPPMTYSHDVNSAYYGQMQEVYELNNTAKAEDNDDMWIAEFWSDDVEGLMMSPPGRQISIATQLIGEYDLGYENALKLLLKLGFALNDSAVSTWADKYEYMVMRPSVFIQNHIDANYETNLYRFIFWPNPSFPSYPSGHSVFASAAAGVFINDFGDQIDFIDKSHEGRTEFRSTPRQFNSFTEMAQENAYSRLPLGVHMRMDCDEGLRLGFEISEAVNNLDLYIN